jgi:hypothetical protein
MHSTFAERNNEIQSNDGESECVCDTEDEEERKQEARTDRQRLYERSNGREANADLNKVHVEE